MFNLIFTCLACAGLAFGANNIDKVQYQSNDNVVFYQELKKNVNYNDASYSITLSVNELNNYTWQNLSDFLVSLDTESNIDEYLSLDGEYGTFNLSFNVSRYNTTPSTAYLSSDSYDEIDGDTYRLGFNQVDTYADVDYTLMFFGFYEGESPVTYFSLESDLTIDFTSTYYAGAKTAIQADILANQPANDNYTGALGDFVSIMVAGLQNFGAGVANGIADFASALFLATDSGGNVTGLSIFGGIIAIFAGLALAVGITTRVYLWVTSLGK